MSGCAYTFISCVAQAAIKEVSDCDLCCICIGILVADECVCVCVHGS